MTATIPSLVEIDGSKLSLNLHPGQTRAWDSRRRFVFVFAGTQSGKTSFGPWWLWREIKACGAGDYIAATASYDLFKLKLLPELRECFEHKLRIGRYWAGDRVIEIADPSSGRFLAKHADDQMWARIILRSAESGGGLESATAKAALLDECGQDSFTVETWEAVRRRLALHRGRCLGATTVYNLGWTYSEIFQRWQDGDSDIECVQFSSVQNPSFPRAEYEDARDKMPEWRFLMFYEGMFAKPAGLIYDCFNSRIGKGHVVEDFPVPPRWPRWVGMDFGGVHQSLVWLAYDRDQDVYFLYRESLEGGMSTKEHADQAKLNAKGENVVEWWGGAGSEDQHRREWENEGILVQRPPVSEVEVGIDRVYGLLKTYRLKVFRSCKGVIDEFGSYRRKLDPKGQPLIKIVDKRKYHRLDAIRYVASGITGDAGVVRVSNRLGLGRQ